jgi:hypothetical protein
MPTTQAPVPRRDRGFFGELSPAEFCVLIYRGTEEMGLNNMDLAQQPRYTGERSVPRASHRPPSVEATGFFDGRVGDGRKVSPIRQ